jgi:hypothetical protein
MIGVKKMITRYKTNKETELHLIEIQKNLSLPTKAAVMKIAVGLAILNSKDEKINYLKYELRNQDGVDYSRSTIVGNDEKLLNLYFESLDIINIGEDFFPEGFHTLLVKGIDLLASEVKYQKTKERFFDFLVKKIEL